MRDETGRRDASWLRTWTARDIMDDYLKDQDRAERYWNPDLTDEDWFNQPNIQALYKSRKAFFRLPHESPEDYKKRMRPYI